MKLPYDLHLPLEILGCSFNSIQLCICTSFTALELIYVEHYHNSDTFRRVTRAATSLLPFIFRKVIHWCHQLHVQNRSVKKYLNIVMIIIYL